MTVTLGIDVYGTLIDTAGVTDALQPVAGERALAVALRWREKQLEYSFRRGLMQNYVNFAACTAQALDYVAEEFGVSLSGTQKEALLDSYKVLPAFDDVEEGLKRARDAGFAMYAFSNGSAAAVETLLRTAGIRDFFEGVVSADDLRSFKPNPAVYSHFLRQTGALGSAAWLVSSNPFDVIGAISAGMRAAWVQRSAKTIFDPWGIEPTVKVGGLGELAQRIAESGGA